MSGKYGKFGRARVVSVNMGYGHQRTAYPLRNLAFGEKIINANDYKGIPEKDKKIWESTKGFYEFVSRFKRIPLIGSFVFYLFDKFQRIPVFYPERDLSRPTFAAKRIFALIQKGWGRDLVNKLRKPSLPLLTTFFTPAFMAEAFDYPGDIFCVICDADIARAWAPLNPKKSRIKYFAPTKRVQERLKMYGVKKENIFLTGYPLPKENIGKASMEILKDDFGRRIVNLDPKGKNKRRKSDRPLTILFSIGGAGAQKEIALQYMESLKEKVERGEVKIILAVGIKKAVRDYFGKAIKKLRLIKSKNIEIVFSKDIQNYFKIFNRKLRETDILWTKPSELSFYSAFGIPIIVAPAIGSQEDINRDWLLEIGAGILEQNPQKANKWIFDYLREGRFFRAALNGFKRAEKLGTFNIEKYV